MAEHPFRAFIELITFDQGVHKTQLDIQALKKEVANLKHKEQEFTKIVEQAKEKVVQARKIVDEQELEMKSLDMQAQNKTARLDSVAGNYKEYQALKNEIDTINLARQKLEDNLIGSWNKFEAAQRESENQQKSSEEQIQTLAHAMQEKEQTIATSEAQLHTTLQERLAKEQLVPQEWLEKYSIMKARVSDPVVPVQQTSCSACFYHIPDQEMLRLKRGALLQCKQCFRLLYLPEAMQAGM